MAAVSAAKAKGVPAIPKLNYKNSINKQTLMCLCASQVDKTEMLNETYLLGELKFDDRILSTVDSFRGYTSALLISVIMKYLICDSLLFQQINMVGKFGPTVKC